MKEGCTALALWSRTKGPVWLTLAYGANRLLQWLLVVALGREFGLASVGSYSAAMAVIVPVIAAAGLNSRGLQLADVVGRWSLATAFRVRLLGICMALPLILLASILVGDRSGTAFWMILFARSGAEALSEPLHTFMIGEQRYRSFATTYLFRSVFSVALFYILAKATGSMLGAFAAWAAAWIISLVLRDLRLTAVVARMQAEPFTWGPVREFAMASAPLAAIGLINSLYASVPLLFMASISGLEAVGLYAVSSYATLAIGVVVGSVTLTSAKPIANWFHEGSMHHIHRRVARQVAGVLALCLPTIVVLFFYGERLLSLVYGYDLSGQGLVVAIQMAAAMLQLCGRVIGSAVTAMGQNGRQVAIGVASVLALVLCCAVLVPSFGLLGAAISLCVSFSLKFALLLFLLSRIRASTPPTVE